MACLCPDLDSLCSSIFYAYLRSHCPPYHLHVPIANLPRSDLGLRPEVTTVLRKVGLGPADLPTLSELPDLSLGDYSWVLVDHNAPTGPIRSSTGPLVACIDHHQDEGVVPADASPRLIEPCGSCMSLIVDQTKSAWLGLASEQPSPEDEKLAKLGLAAILIDTINLTAQDKVKKLDTLAVNLLKSHICDPNFSRHQFWNSISIVKEDISNLSFRDILRKDYKQWNDFGLSLGVSCVVQGFSYLLDRAGGPAPFLGHLRSWALERDLDIAAVMTTSHPDGHFQRQLLVWGLSEQGCHAASRFSHHARDQLGLKTWESGLLDETEPGMRFAWRQMELAASRKQIAPLLREAMRIG